MVVVDGGGQDSGARPVIAGQMLASDTPIHRYTDTVLRSVF